VAHPCEEVSKIACFFKERIKILTRPRNIKVARALQAGVVKAKYDFLQLE
jgi:hypothetical protein